MKKSKYQTIMKFFNKKICREKYSAKEWDNLKSEYRILEQEIFKKYVDRKHNSIYFEKPLINCYKLITKNCQICSSLNVSYFTKNKIDDETMLLDLEKEELQNYSDNLFSFIHCLYCDEHFENSEINFEKTFSCNNCQPKIIDI